MNNKYPQKSQGLPENYSEDSSENFDASLVAFLKQNKPIAPISAPDFEQQLFVEISKYPQRSPLKSPESQKSNLRHWFPWALLIPAAIATGITFNWTTNRSQLQLASNTIQISESEKAAIEQSLISSWNVTDDVVLQATNMATPTDTQILIGLDPLEYE